MAFSGNSQNYFDISANDDCLDDEDSALVSDQTNNSIEKHFLDSFNDLKRIRKRNHNRLIIAQININSLRSKFKFFLQIANNNVDILLVSETKIDSSFPNAQFHIIGYTAYRLDRTQNGGGLLLYVKEDIPSNMLNIDSPIESFFIEILSESTKRFTKNKLLCIASPSDPDCNCRIERQDRWPLRPV